MATKVDFVASFSLAANHSEIVGTVHGARDVIPRVSVCLITWGRCVCYTFCKPGGVLP
jgi:hypothetical protein